MELADQLKQDGVAKGLCRLWRGKLKAGMSIETVSYTHLDVYKRQMLSRILILGFTPRTGELVTGYLDVSAR